MRPHPFLLIAGAPGPSRLAWRGPTHYGNKAAICAAGTTS